MQFRCFPRPLFEKDTEATKLQRQVSSQVQLGNEGARDGFLAKRYCRPPDLDVGLGLRQVHHATAFFPLTALFEQIDALETFQNVALGCNGTGGTEAAMLGHKRVL